LFERATVFWLPGELVGIGGFRTEAVTRRGRSAQSVALFVELHRAGTDRSRDRSGRGDLPLPLNERSRQMTALPVFVGWLKFPLRVVEQISR
jgi:hypothetical protein